jgi:hypothetical protein
MATYNATMPGEYIYVVIFTHPVYMEHDVLVHIAIDGFSKYRFKALCELEFTNVGFAKHIRNTLGQIMELIPDADPTFIFGYGSDILEKDYAAANFPYIYDPLEANRFAIPTIEEFKRLIREHQQK